MVRYFNTEIGKIVTMLLALGTCTEGSSGENIFKVMDNELTKRAILWENCIGFFSDNASVMMGVHKGVVAHVIKKCPNVAVIGCPCHLIHLAAQRAASQLTVDIEDMLVDIYYYLEKSAKGQKELKKCQLLCGAATQKILKHVSTRWLSLGICLYRLLEPWTALENFVSQHLLKPSSPKTKTCTTTKEATTTTNPNKSGSKTPNTTSALANVADPKTASLKPTKPKTIIERLA